MTVLTLPDTAGSERPRRRQTTPAPVRLRRAPLLEPPYDDERTDPQPPQAVELPIDWTPGAGRRAGEVAISRDRLGAWPAGSGGPGSTGPGGASGAGGPGGIGGPDGLGAVGPAHFGAVGARSTASTGGSAGAAVTAGGAATASRDASARPGALAAGVPRVAGVATSARAARDGVSGRPEVSSLPSTAMRSAQPIMSPTALSSAERYVRLCLEVLNGFRPVAHLRTLTGPVEFAEVVTQLNRRRNARGQQRVDTTPEAPPRRNGSPIFQGPTFDTHRNHSYRPTATQPSMPPPTMPPPTMPQPTMPPPTMPPPTMPQPASKPSTTASGSTAAQTPPTAAVRTPAIRRNTISATHPFRLLKLRLSEPSDGVAEVVAVLSHGGCSLAMAMRLERRAGQWLCALVAVI